MIVQGVHEYGVFVLITNHLQSSDIMNLMLTSRVFMHNNYVCPMIIGQLNQIYTNMMHILVDYRASNLFSAPDCMMKLIYAFFNRKYTLTYVSHMKMLRIIHSWTKNVKIVYKNNDDNNSSIFGNIMYTIDKNTNLLNEGLDIFYYTGPFGKVLIKDRYTRMQAKRGGMYVVVQLPEDKRMVEHLGLVIDHHRSKGVHVQIEDRPDTCVWLPEICATWYWA